MAPRIFIFSIVLGAEYLSYVKSIATYAPTLFGYIISVSAQVQACSKERLLSLENRNPYQSRHGGSHNACTN